MAAQSHRRGKVVKRSYADDMRQAAMRASALASGGQAEDDDTDSVASSASSFSSGPPNKKVGVSPLNRRRSLRLAIKNAMDTGDNIPPTALIKQHTNKLFRDLVGQNTVEMKSPPPKVERMDTSTRWTNYRHKRPMLSTQDTIGTKKRIVRRMDTTPDPAPPMKRKSTVKWNNVALTCSSPSIGASNHRQKDEMTPALLKKKSTTWGLRQMFGEADLDDAPEGAAEEEQAGVFNIEHRATLKRKATVLKSPPVLETPKKSALLRRKASVKKQVTVVAPFEEDCADVVQPSVSGAGQMKRQVTLGAAGYGSSGPKTKRRKGSVERQKSRSEVSEIYVPSSDIWPIHLPSQVVWTVPLIGSLGSPINGYAVHIDPGRCLIGDEEGKIIELDSNVVPTKLYEVPFGIKCIVQDEDFIYIGCDDGGLYDITHGHPRLVSHCRGFGKVYSMDVFQGLMAASDHHGNVMLINHRGIVWKRKSVGEFGWMVQIDDTGVYHGHSGGVTKYTLLEGQPVWHMHTEDSVLHGVQKPSGIYVSAGPKVIKLDKLTGAILKTYGKGKAHTRTLHSNAVGGGIVFAGGNKIVCYDEESGEVVYVLSHQFNPASMKYFSGRLFTVGKGAMNVLDFTESTVTSAMAGVNLHTVEVTPNPSAPNYTPLNELKSVTTKQAETKGIIIECVRPRARKGKMLARTKSKKYNNDWDIQIPEELCKEGRRFWVQDLKPSDSGGFYRIFGDLQAIE